MIYDDDERPVSRECAACRRGWHHECWGPSPSQWRTTFCGCACHYDDEPDEEQAA